MDRHKSYLTDVQNGGGVKATFGQCPKERRFFLCLPLVRAVPTYCFLNLGEICGQTQEMLNITKLQARVKKKRIHIISGLVMTFMFQKTQKLKVCVGSSVV